MRQQSRVNKAEKDAIVKENKMKLKAKTSECLVSSLALHSSFLSMCSILTLLPLCLLQNLETQVEKERAARLEAEARYQRLKELARATVDEMKVKHKATLREERRKHAAIVAEKNSLVRYMEEEVKGYNETFNGLLKELKDAESSTRKSKRQAKKAKKKADSAAIKLRDLTVKYNEMIDQVLDEQLRADELEEKVKEYASVIDTMNQDYEECIDEYESITEYMDEYYESELKKLRPQYIKKYSVKNKTKGTFMQVCSCKYPSNFHQLDLTQCLLHYRCSS